MRRRCLIQYCQGGFTLIELITVIVILAIVASMGTSFITSSTDSYIRTQQRSILINRSRQALEQMTRRLRGALPYSVRVTNGGSCVEFLPIAGGGNYWVDVSDISNGVGASAGPFSTSPYLAEFGAAQFLAIGAMSAAEIYGQTSMFNLNGTIAQGNGGTTVTLASAQTWQRNSINHRFFLVGSGQAICLEVGNIRFYQNLGVGGVTADGSGVLMARGASPNGTLFDALGGTQDRNSRVVIGVNFSEGGETVSFVQEVSLRNVP